MTNEKPVPSIAEFFNANAERVAEYLPIIAAYPVPEGTRLWLVTEEDCLGKSLITPEEGYYLERFNEEGEHRGAFIPTKDFEGKTIPMDGAPFAAAKKDLSLGSVLI